MKKILFLIMIFTLSSCKKSEETKPIVQDIQELVFSSGQLEWEDAYNVTAQTDGILQNAIFDVGSVLQKGQIIASINNRNNKINTNIAQEQLAISNENLTSKSPALLQLQQNIQFAESKYDQDKMQEERYERLYNSQSVSRVEYENMQLAVKNSLSNVNALKKQKLQILQGAKQQQISAEGQLQNSRVTTKFNSIEITKSGTVIKKMKGNGDFVKRGDVIATIANSKSAEAILNIDENSIGKVKIGQDVFLQLNTDKRKVYKAKVSEILSAFDEQAQSFICKAIFEEPLNFSLYGTQLEANILVNEKKNALLIPRSYMGFGNKVNVKGNEEYVLIKPGIISTEYVEVLSGIDKNDVLIPLKL